MDRKTVSLTVIFCSLITLGLSASAQDKKTDENPKYAYATKGVVEIQRETEHWKVLLDESNLGGKEVEVVELTMKAGKTVGRHRHGSLEIFYVLSGKLGHEVNGEMHMLTPGMVGVVRPGDFVRHIVPEESDVKFLIIWAPGGEAKRILDYTKGTPIANGVPAPRAAPPPPPITGQQRAEAAGRGLIGTPAPKLALRTVDGQNINLGSLYGKQAVYLKFWATWCVPCRQQMPHFQRTFEEAGPDLAVIGIDSGFNDSLEEVRKAQKELAVTMPMVLDDGEAGAAFNLRVTPQHIVIGRDGRIQYVGHLADERLDAALVAARAGATASSPLPTSASLPAAPRYGVGDQLPDLSATMLNGSTFRAKEAGGNRPTVLVFMSPWCEGYLANSRPAMSRSCRESREQIDALVKRHTQVRWLGIASGLWATQRDLQTYQAKHKTVVPLALDESGEWFRSFRVMNVPTVLIADAKGKIVRRIDGFDSNWPVQWQN